MKIKEKYCEVCNHVLDLRKETVYTVKVAATIFGMRENWDAVDCPYCGCQNLLKRRYLKDAEQTDQSSTGTKGKGDENEEQEDP